MSETILTAENLKFRYDSEQPGYALNGVSMQVRRGEFVAVLGANGKVRKDEDFIFYGNLKSADGSVTHTGDNRTGEGEDRKSTRLNSSHAT